MKNLFESDAPEYNEPGFTLFMRRVKELGNRLGIEIDSEDIRPMVDRLVRIWHDGMYLDEESVPMLKALREHYIVGLITNWEHSPRIFELIDELGMHDLFDSIIVSDDVGYAKPDPRIFQIALKEHGLKPSEVIYVGDMDARAHDYDLSIVSIINSLSELTEILNS